ncbi:hypothetical protein, partial [Sphaerisporangium rhizosphaerae]
TEDGKMHNHALAFNTLLSSQETDAYTTGNQTHQGPDPRLGRSSRVLKLYQFPAISVKSTDLP